MYRIAFNTAITNIRKSKQHPIIEALSGTEQNFSEKENIDYLNEDINSLYKAIAKLKDVEKAIIKFFSRINEGYQFIKNHKEVLTPFLMLIGLQVLLSIVTINVPVIASEIVKINLNSAGIYIVVPAGIGAILGAITTNKFLKKGWRKKKAIETFLVIELLAFLIFSLVVGFLPFKLVRILLSMIVVSAMGFGFVGLLIPVQTFMQEMTPGGLRGRVFGNFSFVVTIATIFPVIFSGAITELFGIKLLMFFIVLLIAATLFISRKFGQKFLENRMQNGK